MSQPYVGQITLFAGNFAPQNYVLCDGSLLSISEYSVLFTLIGTTYGGDGQNTFAVPDLRGRTPIHQGTSTQGNSYVMGQYAGVEAATVNTNQLPAHTHQMLAQPDPGGESSPANAYLAGSADGQYASAGTGVMGNVLNAAGGNIPHENRQPFLAINYIISLYGVYPSQN